MILPTTYLAALLLLIGSMFCLGTWTNTQKLAFKWRFELFYYDFALGALVCAAIATFTLGSMNSQDLTFSDNLLIAGYRKMAYAVGAGLIFNLGNFLFVAAIAVAGMAVAFPMTFGVAIVTAAVCGFIQNPQGNNAALLFGGVLLVLIGVGLDTLAHSGRVEAIVMASKGALQVDPRTKMALKPPAVARGVLLGVLGGILIGVAYPIVDSARTGDNGVGPYGLALMFAGAMFVSTLLYAPFFINFPVQGDPVQVRDYFKGTKKQHFWGIFGGFIWAAGLVGSMVAASAPPALQVGPALSYSLGQGGALIGSLWGLLAWREFKDAPASARTLLWGTIVLFIAGIALLGLAPVYATK
jgi:glucose uptake protein